MIIWILNISDSPQAIIARFLFLHCICWLSGFNGIVIIHLWDSWGINVPDNRNITELRQRFLRQHKRLIKIQWEIYKRTGLLEPSANSSWKSFLLCMISSKIFVSVSLFILHFVSGTTQYIRLKLASKSFATKYNLCSYFLNFPRSRKP